MRTFSLENDMQAGDQTILEKELSANELKVALKEWREMIILLNAVMTWKNNWFPLIIFCSVTVVYLYAWMINYSILHIICTTGIVVTLLDFFVCGPFKNMLSPNSWDEDKEQTYTVFVESVIDFYVTLKLYIQEFFKLRRTNSNLFYSLVLVPFVSLYYFGTIFNNTFISYISVLVTLLSPGFKMRSDLIKKNVQQYGNMSVAYVSNIINRIKERFH